MSKSYYLLEFGQTHSDLSCLHTGRCTLVLDVHWRYYHIWMKEKIITVKCICKRDFYENCFFFLKIIKGCQFGNHLWFIWAISWYFQNKETQKAQARKRLREDELLCLLYCWCCNELKLVANRWSVPLIYQLWIFSTLNACLNIRHLWGELNCLVMPLLCVGLTFGFLATHYVQYGSVPPQDFQRMRDHCWWSWQRWFCTQMSGLQTTRDETLFLSWYSIRWKNDCLYNHQRLVKHYVPDQLLTGMCVYVGPNSIEVWLKQSKREILDQIILF